ncbi:putative PEK protein kinase [Rosellinia necatrix]|uniref:Putative PEK protein kinase n=1 Tax=Rosellinia necatrix TaxID=77044 RepID=A0A1S7UMK3_ROSNE|nr:putative PEK protein kinase [Rosellinia necatrix]
MESTNVSGRSRESTDDDVQSISRSSREQLPDQAEALAGSEDAAGMEKHRDMMLASLLEDYCRSRALEFLQAAGPDRHYTRQSQEVDAVAGSLFNQARQVLSSNGLLPSGPTSDESRRLRQQYLSGLDALFAGSQAPDILNVTMHDLVAQTSQLNLMSHPASDLQLTLHQLLPPPPHSHYKSSFREDRLLGRGGFGKVYQCYNLLDQKTYAVKKIALPPKLVKSLSDGRHDDLQHILREVKAMAVLDHPNIVRYHATWFEKPQQSPELLGRPGSAMGPVRNHRQRLLLDSHAFTEASEYESSMSGGVVFGEDTPSHQSVESKDHKLNPINMGWSKDASLGLDVVSASSTFESNIFAGGESDSDSISPGNGDSTTEAQVHALYIQMSIYPMTLAQFMSPASSSNPGSRHCFHLAPSLRLILSIHDGLQYIHSKGLIHRDIKPGNIFLSAPASAPGTGCCDVSCRLCAECDKRVTPSSRWLNPRIGDFGLVHQLAQREIPSSPADSDDSGNNAGTTYYQPPRKGERKDEKVDIFALGVVLIEMLCRCNTAMERADMLKGLQHGKLPLNLRQGIQDEGYDLETTESVMRLVSSMVDEDPERRWSGSRVREALEDLLGRCCE